jgi:hypothetical protein
MSAEILRGKRRIALKVISESLAQSLCPANSPTDMHDFPPSADDIHARMLGCGHRLTFSGKRNFGLCYEPPKQMSNPLLLGRYAVLLAQPPVIILSSLLPIHKNPTEIYLLIERIVNLLSLDLRYGAPGGIISWQNFFAYLWPP